MQSLVCGQSSVQSSMRPVKYAEFSMRPVKYAANQVYESHVLVAYTPGSCLFGQQEHTFCCRGLTGTRV